jgi:hypothetical protein
MEGEADPWPDGTPSTGNGYVGDAELLEVPDIAG